MFVTSRWTLTPKVTGSNRTSFPWTTAEEHVSCFWPPSKFSHLTNILSSRHLCRHHHYHHHQQHHLQTMTMMMLLRWSSALCTSQALHCMILYSSLTFLTEKLFYQIHYKITVNVNNIIITYTILFLDNLFLDIRTIRQIFLKMSLVKPFCG